jgi:tetratricopeptide (TPR) repeat protein
LPPVKGHTALAHHIAAALVADEFDLSFFQDRPLDHGFFSPLCMMWEHEAGWPGTVVPLQVGVLQSPSPSARRCYKLGQSLRKAIESYRQAISLDSHNIAAWESLGELLLGHHHLEAALIAFKRLVDIDPTNPVGWAGLGAAFFESVDEEQAIDAFKNAVALKSTSGPVYRDLGRLLASRGNYAQAALLLRTSLEFLPDEAERALCYGAWTASSSS